MYEDQLLNSVSGLEVAEPLVLDGLAMFPLVGDDKPGPKYLTLDEALNDELAEITEVTEQGSVPELCFENMSDEPVLLVDGEELIGAKQNRVLNLTILVRPKSKVTIPVSCVESGRWAFRERRFKSSDRTMFARAKASKLSQVSASLRAQRGSYSNQSQVWADIEQKLASMNTAAPTRSMSDSYDQHRTGVDTFVKAMPALARQRGAIFMIDGVVAGLELFDKAQTYAKLASKLVRSYALDAMEVDTKDGMKPDPRIAAVSLERVKKLKVEAYPGTDLGIDWRMSDAEMDGAALVSDGVILHLEAFTRQENSLRLSDGNPNART